MATEDDAFDFGAALRDGDTALTEFIGALGGDPEKKIPFQGEPNQGNELPPELFVKHDTEFLKWLMKATRRSLSPVVLSEAGTGKTTLSLLFEEQAVENGGALVSRIHGGSGNLTKRRLLTTVAQDIVDAGYEYDDGDYGAIWKDGFPHATAEVGGLVRELLQKAKEGHESVIVIVDQIGQISTQEYGALQSLHDAGAVLFVMGVPSAEKKLKQHSGGNDERLYERLTKYDGSIKPFGEPDIQEYLTKMLEYVASDDTADKVDLFGDELVTAIHNATGGLPREVHRAAVLVFDLDIEQYDTHGTLDQVTVTQEKFNQTNVEFQTVEGVKSD